MFHTQQTVGKFIMVPGLALLTCLYMASPAHAKKDKPAPEAWSDWSSLGAGFLARRREPEKMDRPVSERRLATTQARAISKKSRSAKGKKWRQWRQWRGNAASSADQLWLYTTEEGLHSVTIAELALHSGASEARLRKKATKGQLSLTNAGSAVSWYFDPATDVIRFPATVYETFYTDTNAYHFTMDHSAAAPMPSSRLRRGKPVRTGADTAFIDTLHFEEEPDFSFSTGPVAAEPDADYWFWDYLYGGYKDQISVPLSIPYPAAQGTARISITLRGWTNLEYGDEHEVYARLNGTDIGSSIVWDGFDSAELVAEFDQGLLDPSGDNTLTLHNSYAAGTHPGQFLDAVDIRYSRMPVSDDDTLWLHNVKAGTQRVGGFSSENITVIEAPAGRSVLRRDILVEPDGLGGWSASFETRAGVDYLVVGDEGDYLASVAADTPSSLAKKSNSADYLVIAPREFSGTANALASYREARFGRVSIAWLDDIYDEFSDGREDPAAITSFMTRVQKQWRTPPSVVTLLGKGSLDMKDRMGYGDNFIPIAMVSTPWAIAVSDDRLLDNDTRQGFAVGRLPITSDEEGLAYLQKLMSYESGNIDAERYHALLVADNADSGGNFAANSEQMAEHLFATAGFDQISTLYHPLDKVRNSLIQSATWQTGYVSYDGHGSSGQVGDGTENFIKASDAALLQNTTYPVFAALTCAAGDDSMPGARSLAAALVLNPTGGAIASLAPTGLSLDQDAQQLAYAFVDSAFAGMNTVGDAVRDAKVQTTGAIGEFMPRIYSVVGEPAVFAR
ncbi:MAG: hypothetical protein KDI17_03920 [Halioglobus sp.]|nr:hypothetical protein [Halioglobus sp.]